MHSPRNLAQNEIALKEGPPACRGPLLVVRGRAGVSVVQADWVAFVGRFRNLAYP